MSQALFFLITALGAGIAQGFSFVPPRSFVQLVAAAVFIYGLYHARTKKDGFLQGLFFGFGWFGLSVAWVYISIHEYGYQPALIAGLATFLFVFILALFPAFFGFFATLLNRRGSLVLWIFSAPALWALTEWLRSWVFSGFPWAAPAYAHVDGALRGFAPVCGTVGMNYLCVLIAALAAVFFLARRRLLLRSVCLVACVGILAGGAALHEVSWSRPDRILPFRLVQGGVAQDEKFSPMGSETSFQRYLSLMESPGLRKDQVIVLPETIFPISIDRLSPKLWERFTAITQQGHPLLFGGFIRKNDAFVNSVIEVDKGRIKAEYVKRHLVPFGEYVPFGFRWFIDMLGIPMGDLERGPLEPVSFSFEGVRAGFMLCYEDLFGEEVRAWWRSGESPNVLINLSNLGWFGDSSALPQHLNISRLRAMETARPVIRATNTGATAYIDEKGTVVGQLPMMAPGKLDVSVQTAAGEPTPFVRFGEAPFVVFFVILLIPVIAGNSLKRLYRTV